MSGPNCGIDPGGKPVNEYPLFINGQWAPSGAGTLIDDINPATGEVYARVHEGSEQDLETAVAAAHAAFQDWGLALAREREGYLLAAAEALQSRLHDFAEVLINEGGSPFGKAMFEAGFCANMLRSAAGECRRIHGETMPSDSPGMFSMSIRRPLGVVGAIAPFNFPLLLALKKVCMAIAAGNTVVLKPAGTTPVIGLKIAELFDSVGLPPGVVNVVPARGSDAGKVFTSDPRVRLVTFTGSTAVGRKLAARAAENLKKCTLELGGKSPLVVLRDADIDYAVNTSAFSVFLHQGQICMAGSRVIVEEPIYDAFVEKLVAKVASLKVGNPNEPDTVIGPLISQDQCEFIDAQVADAKDKGARVCAGGTHQGNFYQPTVIADVESGMSVYAEESFGPVVSVIKVKDSEEALQVANDTVYGLSSAVITNDLQKAMSLARRLQAGMVHINHSTAYDEPHVPFGGTKDSGMGREGGHFSMEEMTELKWITVQMGERHYPF